MASKIDIGNLADEICLGTSNMSNVETTTATTTADFSLGFKKNRIVIGNSQSDVYINGTLHYDSDAITTSSNDKRVARRVVFAKCRFRLCCRFGILLLCPKFD